MTSEAVVAENNKSPSRVTDDELNKWTRLASAATPGPWTGTDGCAVFVDPIVDEPRLIADTFYVSGDGGQRFRAPWPQPQCKANAAFVAAARSAVPKLLLEVAQLRHELDKALMDASYAKDIIARLERHPMAPERCPKCEWTNVHLVNYSRTDKPRWLCHGCAADVIAAAQP